VVEHIGAYGARIWPAQIVFSIAALLLIGWLFLKPGHIQDLLIKPYLSVAFAWNGIVFFLTLAKGITGEGYGNCLFGSLFMIVSVLVAVDLFRKRMRFSLPVSRWRRHTGEGNSIR